MDLLSKLGLRRARPREGVRIFGVGAAKTGTHSLGTMFETLVPSSHEMDAEPLIERHLKREATGRADELHAYLRRRDAKRGLKIDASQVNIYLIDDLEQLFPGSRYVLTVRPPLQWLRSMIDDSLRRDIPETWRKFRDYRFRRNDGFTAADAPLQSRGLYPLAGYLNYWSEAVERVADGVPRDRLLVVETKDLGPRSAEIAAFCGIAGASATDEQAHAFANPERFGVLEELDEAYLRQTAERICGPSARRLAQEFGVDAGLLERR